MGLFDPKFSPPFHSEVGMPSVMPNQSDTDAIRQLPINKVIRETPQIRTMEAGLDRVKPLRLSSSHSHRPAQFRFEFLSQLLRNRIVALQRLSHILLNSGMEFDAHCLRRASTRLQKSPSCKG